MNHKQLVITVFILTLITFVFFFGRSHHITDFDPGKQYTVSGGIGIRDSVHSYSSPYPIYSRRLDDEGIFLFTGITITIGILLYRMAKDQDSKSR